MELQVAGLEDIEERIGTALDRIAELQIGTQIQSDAFFTGDFQDVPRERFDEYVTAETDFESWEGMKTQAAEEEIIDQVSPLIYSTPGTVRKR